MGIGGIFFKAQDPEKLTAWYQQNLGFAQAHGNMALFRWRAQDNPEQTRTTVWSTFKQDTTYFNPSQASFMINYQVTDLDKMLEQLRAQGVQVDEKIEESDFGRFGWAMDPEGNRIELWEPPRNK